MFCPNCGKEIQDNALFCSSCGARVSSVDYNQVSPKSRLATTLLCAFVGGLGIHRFYVGRVCSGIFMILTLGGLGIWALVDFIVAVCGCFKDKQGRLIRNW